MDPALKKELEDLFDRKINKKIDKVYDRMEENHQEIKPVLDGIKAITAGRKAIFWVTSLVVAIGGAILMIRKIF